MARQSDGTFEQNKKEECQVECWKSDSGYADGSRKWQNHTHTHRGGGGAKRGCQVECWRVTADMLTDHESGRTTQRECERERDGERDRDRARERERDTHTHTHTQRHRDRQRQRQRQRQAERQRTRWRRGGCRWGGVGRQETFENCFCASIISNALPFVTTMVQLDLYPHKHYPNAICTSISCHPINPSSPEVEKLKKKILLQLFA